MLLLQGTNNFQNNKNSNFDLNLNIFSLFYMEKKTQNKGSAFVFLDTLKVKNKKDFPHLAFNFGSSNA